MCTIVPAQQTPAPAPAPLLIGIDEDLEIDDGLTVLQAYVQLAKTHRKTSFSSFLNVLINYVQRAKNVLKLFLHLPKNSTFLVYPTSSDASYSNSCILKIFTTHLIYPSPNVPSILTKSRSSIPHHHDSMR